MPSEFDIIARFFTRPTPTATLGIGDDCALLLSRPDMLTAISCDMLVSGIHFFADTDPRQLGHKSLAVNLSDLAAMGARPVAFTMALALPAPDEAWLKPFSEGLFAVAEQYRCELIGGDTTRGPLNICVTIFGETPVNEVLRRDQAQPGDDIWVSGVLGEARVALEFLKGSISLEPALREAALTRLQMPTPRVALGMAIRQRAHAAIDLSDGLIGDLSHILSRSKVGATLNIDALPAGPALAGQAQDFRLRCLLAGGDDYELCFTAPPDSRNAILEAAHKTDTPVTRVGVIEPTSGLRLLNAKGEAQTFRHTSFDHFLNS
ncbi:MAG: thiamine-phosphate kinase [Burkholderiaceae bacterium]|jgi:thiamine-monophosphate kinase|nr:thiamine-phosphate kinase [Burkholderiaceae bacterium]